MNTSTLEFSTTTIGYPFNIECDVKNPEKQSHVGYIYLHLVNLMLICMVLGRYLVNVGYINIPYVECMGSGLTSFLDLVGPAIRLSASGTNLASI